MKKLSLKKLTETIRSLITNRGRMARLSGAIAAVVLLCAILSGLMLIQFAPNYPTRGENPSQPSQVASNSQASSPNSPNSTNSTVPSQPAPNYPTTETISNVGSLKTIDIEAYWDENLTNRVTGIDWGLLEAGNQKSFSIYLHNKGNSAVTLSMSTSNWNPSAATTYLTLNWNYNGQTIEADKNLQVTLTLSVNASITGITNFSFDIIVVGTG